MIARTAKGRAKVVLHDLEGVPHEVFLEDALHIPSYKQNIFSVQAAVNKGGAVNLTPNSSELSAPDGTKFSVKKYGKLYYLNYTNPNSGAYSAEVWHKILGHCNMGDELKLEHVLEGMKITTKGKLECNTCVQGKCPNIEIGNLQLVQSDLAGPITPESKDGHIKYVMVFVDDYRVSQKFVPLITCDITFERNYTSA